MRTILKSLTIISSLACTALTMTAAQPAERLRVGKAQAQTFAFLPADVGVEAGIFGRHGLDIEITAFGGDARMLQALAADGIDIALGGGPTLAYVAKGAP